MHLIIWEAEITKCLTLSTDQLSRLWLIHLAVFPTGQEFTCGAFTVMQADNWIGKLNCFTLLGKTTEWLRHWKWLNVEDTLFQSDCISLFPPEHFIICARCELGTSANCCHHLGGSMTVIESCVFAVPALCKCMRTCFCTMKKSFLYAVMPLLNWRLSAAVQLSDPEGGRGRRRGEGCSRVSGRFINT